MELYEYYLFHFSDVHLFGKWSAYIYNTIVIIWNEKESKIKHGGFVYIRDIIGATDYVYML